MKERRFLETKEDLPFYQDKKRKIGNQDVQNYKKRRRIYLITGLRVEVLSPKTHRYKNIVSNHGFQFFFQKRKSKLQSF